MKKKSENFHEIRKTVFLCNISAIENLQEVDWKPPSAACYRASLNQL